MLPPNARGARTARQRLGLRQSFGAFPHPPKLPNMVLLGREEGRW